MKRLIVYALTAVMMGVSGPVAQAQDELTLDARIGRTATVVGRGVQMIVPVRYRCTGTDIQFLGIDVKAIQRLSASRLTSGLGSATSGTDFELQCDGEWHTVRVSVDPFDAPFKANKQALIQAQLFLCNPEACTDAKASRLIDVV
jgi:hypothetical protein